MLEKISVRQPFACTFTLGQSVDIRVSRNYSGGLFLLAGEKTMVICMPFFLAGLVTRGFRLLRIR